MNEPGVLVAIVYIYLLKTVSDPYQETTPSEVS